jgi:hypothetical protein
MTLFNLRWATRNSMYITGSNSHSWQTRSSSHSRRLSMRSCLWLSESTRQRWLTSGSQSYSLINISLSLTSARGRQHKRRHKIWKTDSLTCLRSY